jgi:hypothetical protein
MVGLPSNEIELWLGGPGHDGGCDPVVLFSECASLMRTLWGCILVCLASTLWAESERERGIAMIEALGDSPLVLSDRRKHAAYCDTLLQDLRAMKVEFVEPVTETDDPNDPAFAVLAHCSSGPNFGPDPAGSEKSFSALDDIGDSGYRLYFLDRGSAHNPGYVVVYASVAKGKEISAPPLRMTGYNLIDARRCIREFGAQVTCPRLSDHG